LKAGFHWESSEHTSETKPISLDMWKFYVYF